MILYYTNVHVKGLIFRPKHLRLLSKEKSFNVPTWTQLLQQEKPDFGNAPPPSLWLRAAGVGELVGCLGHLLSKAGSVLQPVAED